MSKTSTLDRDIRIADTRGAIYALLANLFRYPDEELCALLDDPLRWMLARKTGADLGEPLARRIAAIEDTFTRICAADQPLDALDRLREDYHRLFGHTAHGLCPPYEMEYGYRDIVQQSPQLADISGFYHAFGLELSAASQERLDHVTVECEFMAVLAARESAALAREDAEGVAILRHAQREFLTDHLGRWAPALAHRVAQADGEGLYACAAGLLADFLQAECERAGASTGPAFLELCPTDPEKDVEFTCGVEESCPGGAERLVQLGIDRSA